MAYPPNPNNNILLLGITIKLLLCVLRIINLSSLETNFLLLHLVARFPQELLRLPLLLTQEALDYLVISNLKHPTNPVNMTIKIPLLQQQEELVERAIILQLSSTAAVVQWVQLTSRAIQHQMQAHFRLLVPRQLTIITIRRLLLFLIMFRIQGAAHKMQQNHLQRT